MSLPLEGITVVDCGQVIAGPTVAALLGDFGAEVIKVEDPRGGDQLRQFGRERDGVSLHSKLISRNKKSITVNLRDERGQALLCRLIAAVEADVLVESFRPGTLERWNLGSDRLKAIRPELVLVRVSGFGQTGPYRNRPGFGTLAEAMSGFAHVTGEANGPPTLPPFALADHVAALYGALGALVSLYLRDACGRGEGQEIDVSLLESLFSALGIYLVEYDQLGIVPQRQGNRTASAPRNTYPTADGRWIAVAGSTQSITARLFRAIGRPELEHDPRFRSNRDRLQNVEELDRIVTEWVSARSQREAIETLLAADVAAAPVMDVRDLATDPHLAAREAIAIVADEQLGTIRLPNVQPRLAETPGAVRHAGPAAGAHTTEILRERLGLNAAEIEHLQEQEVV